MKDAAAAPVDVVVPETAAATTTAAAEDEEDHSRVVQDNIIGGIAMPSTADTVRLTVLQAFRRTLKAPLGRSLEEEDFILFDHPEIALAVERLADSEAAKAFAGKAAEAAEGSAAGICGGGKLNATPMPTPALTPKLTIAVICWDGLNGLGNCLSRDAVKQYECYVNRCKVEAPNPKPDGGSAGALGSKIFGFIPAGEDVWLWRKPLAECLAPPPSASQPRTITPTLTPTPMEVEFWAGVGAGAGAGAGAHPEATATAAEGPAAAAAASNTVPAREVEENALLLSADVPNVAATTTTTTAVTAPAPAPPIPPLASVSPAPAPEEEVRDNSMLFQKCNLRITPAVTDASTTRGGKDSIKQMSLTLDVVGSVFHAAAAGQSNSHHN